jgi:hypothetical protein
VDIGKTTGRFVSEIGARKIESGISALQLGLGLRRGLIRMQLSISFALFPGENSSATSP